MKIKNGKKLKIWNWYLKDEINETKRKTKNNNFQLEDKTEEQNL